MYWANNSDKKLTITLLDFEKAYNRVSWVFIECTSIHLGFFPLWVLWIRALYIDASIQILVNGHKGEPFSLERSVRQGCPLAPYLFLFVADVLGYMLDDSKYGTQSLKLPNHSYLTSIMFADDTSLSLLGYLKNINKAFKVLELYCDASGGKLSGHKTRCIWASNTPRNFISGENIGVQWLQEGEATKYVEIPLGFNISQETKDAAPLAFVNKHLTFWTTKQSSLARRFLNATQAIEGSLWFITWCVDISFKTPKKIRGLIRNYIWSRDAQHKARAKVAWNTFILPTTLGGVKILDLINMSLALLAKFIINGLEPIQAPWKSFFLHHINNLEPSNSKN